MSGPIGLSTVVLRFYEDVRDGIRLNVRNRPYARNGWVRFKQTYDWIKKYTAVNGETDFFELSDLWLKNFLVFLYNHPIALNTVSGLVDNIHAVVNAHIAEGTPLKSLTVRVWPEQVDAVYNSLKELKALHKTDYSHDTLFLVKDIFLIQSHVGFRVGTLKKFLRQPENFLFNEGKKWYIRITTNKTGARVVIPVKKIVHKILRRHNYRFPAVYYESYYNALIKVMAREAGFTERVTVTRTIAGKTTEIVKEKWELMSSHTARRNFATNAFLAGIPIEQIMLITGHRTREEFLKYIRADSLANARSVSKHKFFK